MKVLRDNFTTRVFAERLSQLRAEKELSLDDLAKAVGTSKTTLNKYELKLREPKLSIVKAISDYFNVNLDWLVGFSEERDPVVNQATITDIFNKLSPKGKEELHNFAKYILDKEEGNNGNNAV